jgi:hypothetical protein
VFEFRRDQVRGEVRSIRDNENQLKSPVRFVPFVSYTGDVTRDPEDLWCCTRTQDVIDQDNRGPIDYRHIQPPGRIIPKLKILGVREALRNWACAAHCKGCIRVHFIPGNEV